MLTLTPPVNSRLVIASQHINDHVNVILKPLKRLSSHIEAEAARMMKEVIEHQIPFMPLTATVWRLLVRSVGYYQI